MGAKTKNMSEWDHIQHMKCYGEGASLKAAQYALSEMQLGARFRGADLYHLKNLIKIVYQAGHDAGGHYALDQVLKAATPKKEPVG